ncbi:MAG: TPM domain-containing protein [Ignavibacteriaceae bacterium]
MAINYIYNYMDDDDLLNISSEIKNQEKLTSAEIVLSIKRRRPFLKRLFSQVPNIEAFAKKEFYRLGMNRTKDKTGILIFILFEERRFYVLADKAINEVFTQNTWISVTEIMKTNFAKGEFAQGLISAVTLIGATLKNHFPIKPDDVNEISNKIIIT